MRPDKRSGPKVTTPQDRPRSRRSVTVTDELRVAHLADSLLAVALDEDQELDEDAPRIPVLRVTAPATDPRFVVRCPHCGREHTHSPAYGHRHSHCGGTPGYVIVPGMSRTEARWLLAGGGA
jgi:hypothetical protein